MLAIIATALLQGAAPDPGTAPIVTDPEWTRRPSGDDMLKVYPEAAQKAFLTGRATMQCRIGAAGTLADCKVVSESPEGLGFGDAALRLGRLFKMRTVSRSGQPVAGGEVRIPIRFSLPPDVGGAPATIKNEAFAGWTVELNCRYLNAHLDDCYDAQSRTSRPDAVQAVITLAEGVSLPPMQRPAGRILFAVRFVGAEPTAGGPVVITTPEWLRRPTAAELYRALPERAVRERLSGEAVISCTVTKEGRLTDCVTVSEAPLGAGFAAASLKLMDKFQMNPVQADGRSVEGGTVRVPIRFLSER